MPIDSSRPFTRRLRTGAAATLLVVATYAAYGGVNTASGHRILVRTHAEASAAETLKPSPTPILVGASAPPTSLDPDNVTESLEGNKNALQNLYDPLLSVAPAPNSASLGGGVFINPSRFEPRLATSWTTTDNAVIFTLRKGVLSDYGNPLTAQDVVWTYKRNEAVKSYGASFYSSLDVTDVKALGKYKVEYVTKGPAPLLLATLSEIPVRPIDAVEAEKHVTPSDPWATQWLDTHADGFGPYSVENFQPNQSITLTPRTNYYGTKALSTITILGVADTSTRFSALQSGSLDAILDPTPAEVTQAENRASGLHAFRFPGNLRLFAVLNNSSGILANVDVRRALWTATPSQQIIKSLYGNSAFVVKSPLPSYIRGASDEGWDYTYNLAAAKKLLSKAPGAAGSTIQIYYGTNDTTLASVAAILQSTWEQLGLTVQLDPESYTTIFTQAVASKNIPIWLSDSGSAGASVADGSSIGASYETGGYYNTGNYNNPAFDAAYTASEASYNWAKRDSAIVDMQKQLLTDPAVDYIAGLYTDVLTLSDVGGLGWDPNGVFNFAGVGIIKK